MMQKASDAYTARAKSSLTSLLFTFICPYQHILTCFDADCIPLTAFALMIFSAFSLISHSLLFYAAIAQFPPVDPGRFI